MWSQGDGKQVAILALRNRLSRSLRHPGCHFFFYFWGSSLWAAPEISKRCIEHPCLVLHDHTPPPKGGVRTFPSRSLRHPGVALNTPACFCNGGGWGKGERYEATFPVRKEVKIALRWGGMASK